MVLTICSDPVSLADVDLVLDASTGKPAEGIFIRLQQLEVSKDGGADIFHPLAKGFDSFCMALSLYLLTIP